MQIYTFRKKSLLDRLRITRGYEKVNRFLHSDQVCIIFVVEIGHPKGELK